MTVAMLWKCKSSRRGKSDPCFLSPMHQCTNLHPPSYIQGTSLKSNYDCICTGLDTLQPRQVWSLFSIISANHHNWHYYSKTFKASQIHISCKGLKFATHSTYTTETDQNAQMLFETSYISQLYVVGKRCKIHFKHIFPVVAELVFGDSLILGWKQFWTKMRID